MAKVISQTGGNKEFFDDSSKDLGHTEHTQAFADSLNDWRKKQELNRKITKTAGIIVLAVILILVLLKYLI